MSLNFAPGDCIARATVTSHILKIPESQVLKQSLILGEMLININESILTEDEVDLPDHKMYNNQILKKGP